MPKAKSKYLRRDSKKYDTTASYFLRAQYQAAESQLLPSTLTAEFPFETHTGFTVVGETVSILFSDSQYEVQLFNNETQHIRVEANTDSATMMLGLSNGEGFPVAILMGFVGLITIMEGRVLNINYKPSVGNDRYKDAELFNSELERRRAHIATLARFGQFRVGDNTDEAINVGSYLRKLKSWDPTLGLYAAYSYAEVGYARGINSIYSYMEREREPILYDVAMLTALHEGAPIGTQERVAPFCPLLTQGWSFLSAEYSLFNPFLRETARYLKPNLWTMFREDGLGQIIRYLEKNRKNESGNDTWPGPAR